MKTSEGGPNGDPSEQRGGGASVCPCTGPPPRVSSGVTAVSRRPTDRQGVEPFSHPSTTFCGSSDEHEVGCLVQRGTSTLLPSEEARRTTPPKTHEFHRSPAANSTLVPSTLPKGRRTLASPHLASSFSSLRMSDK